MPGDYSRFTFDKKNRFSEVLWQQGRVTLDSDHNEQSEILTHRDRTFAHDVVGDAAVPRATTPDAFKITAAGSGFNIGAGRIYVDGLVAEAFPTDPLTYATQPFYPDPPPLNAMMGRGLAYLDVWERELTAVQEPALLEPALRGIDTTTRWQTIWQVKIALRRDFRDHDLRCGFDLDTIFPPSPARLTVHVDPPGEEPDPCALPQAGGVRDVENRHYRVEVHGSSTPPQFKFARDPISARIEEIKAGPLATQTILKVTRTGRDSALRFSTGDLVEVLSERLVLRNEPGTMATVVKVDDALREITIDQVITPATPPPDLRAWLTKWDGGLLTVTAGPIALESGISVEFTGGAPRHGDYWMLWSREATHTAEPLVNAPPYGVKHYYTPLAMVDGLGSEEPGVFSDCRTLWPPDCDCECASCVNPEDHRSGRWTIQMAIDKVSSESGGTICLKPGFYLLERPLVIRVASFLGLRGHGDCSVHYTGSDPYALLIESSNDILIENLELTRSAHPSAEVAVILIRNSYYGATIRRCTLQASSRYADGSASKGIGVALDRIVRNAKILDCRITAPVGIAAVVNPATTQPTLMVATDVEIQGNTISATDGGIRLQARTLDTVIRGNAITATTSGIRVEGITRTGRANLIEANSVFTGRSGIGVGADRTTVTDNAICGTFQLDARNSKLVHADQTYSSIAVYGSPSDVRRECRVVGNRCMNTRGMGVLIADPVEALIVTQNFIRYTAGGGVVALDKARNSNLVIEGNDLRDVALGDDDSKHFFGIRLAPMCDADVLENTIDGVGPTGHEQWPVFPANGIRADSPRRLCIRENRIRDVKASPETPSDPRRLGTFGSAAIYVVPPLGVVEITNNTVYTAGVASKSPLTVRNGHVYAIRIQAPPVYDYTVFTLDTSIASAISAASASTRTAAKKAPKKAPKKAASTEVMAPEAAFPSGDRWANYDDYVIVYPIYCWVRLGVATSLVLIRANVVECAGDVDSQLGMVKVDNATLRCTFGGNICAHRWTANQFLLSGVYLRGETVVADSNQIFGRFEEAALSVFDHPSLELWTVIGNIVQREILVNGTPLPAPWRPMNRITF